MHIDNNSEVQITYMYIYLNIRQIPISYSKITLERARLKEAIFSPIISFWLIWHYIVVSLINPEEVPYLWNEFL